jgi:hypothetical protein
MLYNQTLSLKCLNLLPPDPKNKIVFVFERKRKLGRNLKDQQIPQPPFSFAQELRWLFAAFFLVEEQYFLFERLLPLLVFLAFLELFLRV